MLRTGEALLLPEIPDELLVEAARDEEHLAAIRALSIRSGMSVPMVTGGRVLGVMTFVFSESGRVYGEDDLDVRAGAGRRAAATAIENARLYTERSEVARTLQASLLPEELPGRSGLALRRGLPARASAAPTSAATSTTSSRSRAAHMVLLGDVTGKGVAAAALTSLVRHTAKTAAEFDARPSAVLAVVNRALRQRPRIAPVTMLCGAAARRASSRSRSAATRCRCSSAPAGRASGSAAPGCCSARSTTTRAPSEVTVALAPGDTLLLFTDGVTDTPGAAGRFGEARLRAAVDAAPAEPAALLDAYRARARRVRGGRRPRRPRDARGAACLTLTGHRCGPTPTPAASRSSPAAAPGSAARRRSSWRPAAPASRSAAAARSRSRACAPRSRPRAATASRSRRTCASRTRSSAS